MYFIYARKMWRGLKIEMAHLHVKELIRYQWFMRHGTSDLNTNEQFLIFSCCILVCFVVCSTNLFASADTAYVLAYSIIMLTTDLHSPQVRLIPTSVYFYIMIDYSVRWMSLRNDNISDMLLHVHVIHVLNWFYLEKNWPVKMPGHWTLKICLKV